MGLLDKLFKDLDSAFKGSSTPTTKPEKRLCPVDGTFMKLIRIKFSPKDVVEIDQCPKCGGIWFDRGELNKIIKIPISELKRIFGDIKEKKSIKGTSSGPRLCPVCGATMITYNYDYKSGIWLDACPRGHGIWLDGGEILLLKLYLETGETFEAKDEAPKLKKVERADRRERQKTLERELQEAIKALEVEEERERIDTPSTPKREIPLSSSPTPMPPSSTTSTTSFKAPETSVPPAPKPSIMGKPLMPSESTSERTSTPSKPPTPSLGESLKSEQRTEPRTSTPSISTPSTSTSPTSTPTISISTPSSLSSSLSSSATSATSPVSFETKELGGFWSIKDILRLPDGRLVIAGDGGRVMISSGDLEFQQVAELRENISKIGIFNDYLVLASSYGSLFYAPLSDLKNFEKISLGYRSLNYLFNLNGTLVILGSSGTIKVTTDLKNFQDIKLDILGDITAGCYHQGKVIIGGASGLVMLGDDLSSLQRVTIQTSSTIRSIRYIGDSFVAVGTSGMLAKISPDGNAQVSPQKVFSDLNDVVLFKEKFLIPASSGKVFYGDFGALQELKTGGFASYYRALQEGDRVLVVGDKATILIVK